MGIYSAIVKPLAFQFDAEKTHDRAVALGKKLGRFALGKNLLKKIYNYENKKLECEVAGIHFKNPVGLAAGFDKNALLVDIIPCVGFGFMEVGSVTAKKCAGNSKPRLWRLPKDKAIAVNYGLCNDGAETVRRRLKEKKSAIPVGISIAKTNDSSIKGDDSIADYYKSFTLLKDSADFVVLNISCPNVGDGCTFENPALFEKLLKRINNKNKTLFIKLSCTLEKSHVDKIIKIARKNKVSGFIIGNLNKSKKNLKSSREELAKVKGGVSGLPTQKKSNELIKYVYKKTKGKYAIIGVGGIFSAEDAYEKIRKGANLVQLITGMIYKGLGVVKEINKGLVKLLEKDGFEKVSEAVGVDAQK